MDDKTRVLAEMLEGDLSISLLYTKDGHIYPLRGSGIGPLLNLYLANGRIEDFYIADKVVGQAAAFLMKALGAKGVYAHLLAEPARAYLKANDIPVAYKILTPYIENRKKDWLCPFEAALAGIEDEKEAIEAIKKKAAELFGQGGKGKS